MIFDFIFSLLAFVFIYNVPFTALPVSGSKIVVLILLLYVGIKMVHGYRLTIMKNVSTLIVLVILLMSYSVLVTLINASSDYSIVYSCILFLVNHCLGCFLFALVLQMHGKLEINYVLKLLVTVAVMQAVIICLMMFSESIYQFISKLAEIPTRDSIRKRYNGARGYGMASSITYDLGVVQSFALIFIAYLFPAAKKMKVKLLYITSYMLIVVSILVTGRTGLVGVLLSIWLVLRFLKTLAPNTVALFLGLGIMGVICLVIISDKLSGISIFESITQYVFEAFNNYKATGSFSTSTGSNLMNMIGNFFKDISWTSFVFGDGRYKGEGLLYYGNVDLGFLRHIYYFGILGTFLLLIVYFCIYKQTVKRIMDKRLRCVWRLLFVYLMVAHFKGDFLLGCGMGICVILLLYFTMINKGMKECNEESINC